MLLFWMNSDALSQTDSSVSPWILPLFHLSRIKSETLALMIQKRTSIKGFGVPEGPLIFEWGGSEAVFGEWTLDVSVSTDRFLCLGIEVSLTDSGGSCTTGYARVSISSSQVLSHCSEWVWSALEMRGKGVIDRAGLNVMSWWETCAFSEGTEPPAAVGVCPARKRLEITSFRVGNRGSLRVEVMVVSTGSTTTSSLLRFFDLIGPNCASWWA